MLAIQTDIQGDEWIVHLQGDVDLATADTLRSELGKADQSSTSRVVVDLRQVKFMGSLGASVIIYYRDRLRQQGRGLSICDCSPSAARIFGLMHREDLLPSRG